MRLDVCPVCADARAGYTELKRDPAAGRDGDAAPRVRVRCETCGTCIMPADRIAEVAGPEWRASAHRVAARLREASDAGREVDLGQLTLDQLTAGLPERPDPVDCMNRILLHIHSRVASPVDTIELDGDDWPIARARNAEEFFHYVRHLAARGDIGIDTGVTYRLTIEGWKRVEEIRRSSADSDQAFVAMWFDASMQQVIWTCHGDHVEGLHFDTRQYNDTAWRTAEELRSRLTWRIRATIPGRAEHSRAGGA